MNRKEPSFESKKLDDLPIESESNSKNMYEKPGSELSQSEKHDEKASVWFRLIAAITFMIYLAANCLVALRLGKSDAELLGTAVGSFVWPVGVVLISHLWKENRNSKSRTKIFFATSLILLVLKVSTFFAVGQYVGK